MYFVNVSLGVCVTQCVYDIRIVEVETNQQQTQIEFIEFVNTILCVRNMPRKKAAAKNSLTHRAQHREYHYKNRFVLYLFSVILFDGFCKNIESLIYSFRSRGVFFAFSACRSLAYLCVCGGNSKQKVCKQKKTEKEEEEAPSHRISSPQKKQQRKQTQN